MTAKPPIPFGWNALAPPAADNAMGSLEIYRMTPFEPRFPSPLGLLGLFPFQPELSDEAAKFAAWSAIAAHPLDEIAFDRYGNELHWSEHGKQDSRYGWHVDHYPTAKRDGGRLVAGNVQALHWRFNVTLGARMRSAE